jgi:nitroreductase
MTNAPMNTIDAINTRTSVRAYQATVLDKSVIDSLLAMAVRAPTAIHEEQWAFAVMQGHALLQRISAQVRAPFANELKSQPSVSAPMLDKFSNPEFNLFYDASTLILICAEPMGKFVESDCWLAAENLMLAAHAMGLGTCVIGSAVMGLNQPDVKAELGLPEELQVVAPIIVGIPAQQTSPTQRRAPSIVSWRYAD